MKKNILFIILFFVLLIIPGCTKVETKEFDVNNNTDLNLKLLSGYPKDILPIYKAINIEDTSFSYRDDYNYTVGKDIYSISYISDADIDSVSSYYLSLLTQTDEKGESWFDKYSFTGAINDNHVIIGMTESYDDTDNTRVNLTIGLAEKEYVNENPYFTNYPDDLVEVYGLKELQDITYKKDYFYKQELYTTIYETDITETEFENYYKPKYENMTNFKYEKDSYGNKMTWTDRGFEIKLSYSISGNYKWINIYAYYKN